MKLRLLGTGGADGIPGLYSQSRVSQYARECKGKDIRTRSSALVDDGIKLDLPPDIFFQLTREGLSPKEWTAVVFTHSDDDHLAASQIQYALYPFTESVELEFSLFGNAEVIDRIMRRYPDWPIDAVVTHSFEPFSHGDYLVTPFHANHKSDEDSQNLVIERAGKTLVYATDTGIWAEESWEFLESKTADALVIECTDGFEPSTYAGHLNIASCVEVVGRLRKLGTLSGDSQVFTTHHSHKGNATHEELVKALEPHGIKPGFDGLAIDI